MTSSLVGSEMCIRDRQRVEQLERHVRALYKVLVGRTAGCKSWWCPPRRCCLLYTSDAADDM
eukprot:12784375-Prorocentrum_lima.AAC.1